ncbi:MAG: SpoIIE family protein phosphatase [Candidatus Schekmanbacteria bacterium]|nr:SpoIIE family protein phosphatase [Candidatus Schekmanbacteria bacterium]
MTDELSSTSSDPSGEDGGESKLRDRRKLVMLLEVARAMNESLQLSEVLALVMDEVLQLTGAARGFLMLGSSPDSLQMAIARNISEKIIRQTSFDGSRSVIREVAATRQPMVVEDASAHMQLSMADSVRLTGIRAVMCVPMIRRNELIGIIYVDSRNITQLFTDGDLEVLTALAGHAAGAIENARLFQAVQRREKLAQEVRTVGRIRKGLLPKSLPEVEGMEVAARMLPGRGGAAFYDVISPATLRHDLEARSSLADTGVHRTQELVESATGDQELALVVGEAGGQELGAALITSICRTMVRSAMRTEPDIQAVMRNINVSLNRDVLYRFPIGLLLASICVSPPVLRYSAAAAPLPLLIRTATRTSRPAPVPLSAQGSFHLPIGVSVTSRYASSEMSLSRGDVLVAYTQSVLERTNDANVPFGIERLERIMERVATENAQVITEAVIERIEAYGAGEAPKDAVVIVARLV